MNGQAGAASRIRRGTLRLAASLPGAARDALLGLVYPPTCIACGAATGLPHALCPACWRGVRFIERPYCERLGTPFAVDLGVPGLLSPAAMADPPVFARARAALRYDATAKRLVHRLKYEDRLDLAAAMGAMMARAGRELIAEADVAVPVPLWRWRLWWRRFNQAMLLARHATRGSGLAVAPDLLARVKRTRPQVGLSRAARAENLQGAFRVPEAARPRLAGRRVLLVDDVITTGSTANAAARALLRGGAAAVDVLAFACVVQDGRVLGGEAAPEPLTAP
ncbi:ComF family protein [Methylobacterium sp. WSM2598]|uniref:ComF family protein n=1 Tax=Methylobacterium sp. WSM2598 TaxID=398261 RepID=UPI0003762EDB|nr:ComF family protein [Methylobacterium sp. WSM2598]